MTRRFGPSLVFASDKVIFDALNHSQVPVDLIRRLLFDRGILVSHKTEKADLAEDFSRLTADYFDHKSIAQKLGKVSKKERVTYTEVKEKLTIDQIKAGTASVIQQLRDMGNVVDLVTEGGTVQIRVQYEHIDYTESEFRQVQPRDAVIEFIPDEDNNYIVRNTHNNYIDNAAQSMFGGIEAVIGKRLSLRQISLEGFTDPKERTSFFEALIDDIEGYRLETVTDAYCYKPKRTGMIGGDDGEERAADTERQPYVVRVTLKGSDVNKTFMADNLYKEGYYLVKVVWQMKAKNRDYEVIELEAQFGEPSTCTEFSYQARCGITCRDGVVTDEKRAILSGEQDTYFRLIEAAARRALATLEA